MFKKESIMIGYQPLHKEKSPNNFHFRPRNFVFAINFVLTLIGTDDQEGKSDDWLPATAREKSRNIIVIFGHEISFLL
jgi:hypothetical protein